jgi:hypothetical protein
MPDTEAFSESVTGRVQHWGGGCVVDLDGDEVGGFGAVVVAIEIELQREMVESCPVHWWNAGGFRL